MANGLTKVLYRDICQSRSIHEYHRDGISRQTPSLYELFSFGAEGGGDALFRGRVVDNVLLVDNCWRIRKGQIYRAVLDIRVSIMD